MIINAKYSSTLGLSFVALFLIGCDRGGPPKKESRANENAPEMANPQQVIDHEKSSSGDSKKKQFQRPSLKQKFPELVTQPEQENLIAIKLRTVIKAANGDPAVLANKFTQLWDESIAKVSASPLLSAEDPDVANGNRLPPEILQILRKFDARSGEDSNEAMLCGVSMWSALLHSDLLTQFAKKRANSLPPTASDVAIFEALNTGIHELNPAREDASFELWEPFSDSSNPIYRLLALRASMVTTSRAAAELSPETDDYTRINASSKIRFYLKYLNESDPVILCEAIRDLSFVPLPEAHQAIKKFLADQQDLGNTVLIQAATDALRTQERINGEER